MMMIQGTTCCWLVRRGHHCTFMYKSYAYTHRSRADSELEGLLPVTASGRKRCQAARQKDHILTCNSKSPGKATWRKLAVRDKITPIRSHTSIIGLRIQRTLDLAFSPVNSGCRNRFPSTPPVKNS